MLARRLFLLWPENECGAGATLDDPFGHAAKENPFNSFGAMGADYNQIHALVLGIFDYGIDHIALGHFTSATHPSLFAAVDKIGHSLFGMGKGFLFVLWQIGWDEVRVDHHRFYNVEEG